MSDDGKIARQKLSNRLKRNTELVMLAICSLVVVYSDVKQVSLLWLMLAVFCSIIGGILLFAIVIAGTSLRSILFGFVFASVILSVWVSNWPMQAAFSYSEVALEKLAEKVNAEQRVDVPQYAGVYRIEGVEKKRDGTICLWTDLHPSGNAGFVKTSHATPRLNIAIHRRLTDEWHVLAVD